ncbi:MAG TPA: helix-turn-helix domain-containing protein [Lactobacillaceae bacterium]|jgi:excisionase family DNA binding protein
MTNSTWLNGKEAAQYLNISYNTFLTARKAGKIRYHQLTKQTILYNKDELMEDIKQA